MNSLKRIIQESFIIAENIQQADKIYFKTGLLSPNVRKHIVHITEGDAWTKLLTDIYYTEMINWKKNGHWAVGAIGDKYKEPESESEYHTPGQDDMMNLEDWKKMRQFHNQLKTYNKNVFPIIGLSANGVKDIWELIRSLKERGSILEFLKQMPSVAIRNMKADIRTERNSSDLQSYRHGLEHFLLYYSLLGNRDPKLRKNVENKMFIAGVTLNDLLGFVEEKENLLGGAKFTKNSIKKIVRENSQNELEIIYENGNYMVVEVVGPHGIKEIGCNSLWCFTYNSGFDGAWRQWNNYSTNGIVYAIIDFSEPSDSPDFMHVLIKPLDYSADTQSDDGDENDSKLFNMANEESYNSLGFIEGSIGTDTAKKLLTFGEEPEEEEDAAEEEEDAAEEKSEPEYQDSNQLQLNLQEFRLMVRKKFLNEAKSEFSKLEDNKVPLTDEERKKVMDSDAVWHFSPGNKPTPAVWKSEDKDGKITYVTNTHTERFNQDQH